MDSATFWEESGSVRIPVKFESCSSSDGGTVTLQPCKEEQSLFQFCDGNLNFATVATSEDDEFSFNKKKISRDPMSHRIIEKRRRDRMNNCLADLSRLIPADYLKKGRGRIEKTEIIEMAIKHMKHLQIRATKPADCDLECAPTPPEENRQDRSSAPPPIDTEHYRLGYQECLSEAMHFMVEVEGFYAGDPLCVQLINHLQKHCDKILKGDRLNCPRAHVNETTSNSSGSSGSYPHHNHPHSSSSSSDRRRDDRSAPYDDDDDDEDDVDDDEDHVVDLTGGGARSRLRDMLTSPNLVSHNNPPPAASATTAAASLYKFKNNIKQRFTAEHRDDGSLLKRRRFEPPPGELVRRHSDTCSIPSSPPPSPPSPRSPVNVPIFALHARGSYYVPLTLDADVLTPYFDELNIADDAASSSVHNSEASSAATAMVLHPVTISVNFKHTGHKMDSRPSRALSSMGLLWKSDPSGFVPWFHADRHALTIPPYSKHV